MAIYDINGSNIETGGVAINYDATVTAVNHRGYNTVAPENTLPAFKLSKKNGFQIVETDVQFTSDGVAVCLHDRNISRTSDGTGNIDSMTWEQVQTYDFGSWKSSAYAGTKIPSFEQFLSLCKDIGLHPYIELKSDAPYTQAQIESVVDMVHAYGMDKYSTYISFSSAFLGYVKNYDANARLGFLKSVAATSDISTIQGLKTTTNEVYYGAKYTSVTSVICEAYQAAGIPIEIWTVDTASDITNMNPYITGVTSNVLIAGKVLYDANIN